MPNRRNFLSGLASFAGASAAPRLLSGAHLRPMLSPEASTRPNIIFFLVDDLGWGDFGCYGDTFHETPHVDRLAKESVKFTRAYAAAPVCSPSRAAIMTGQTPARLQLTQWIPGTVYPGKKLLEAPSALHLPSNAITLAQRLKQLGYHTAAIGKWHLGGEGFLPENFGFDVNFAGDDHGSPPPPNGYFGPFPFHNPRGYTHADYLTEVLTQKMEQVLEQAVAKGPFFLYMAEYAVHIPLQEREALVEKYRRKNGGKDEPDPVYAAMVESVDTALGNLRAKLDALGVGKNTIIVLTSDNGGVGFQGRKLHRIADNAQLRAGKGYLYEGGIREPLIVHWPGVTKAGTVCDVPVMGEDFLPTILGMIDGGAPPQPCDGLDFSSLLRGGTSLPRETLYWHYPHYSDQGGTPSGAIIEGDWKLIVFFEDDHVEIYNLALDPTEQYDFASSFSDKASSLREKLVSWRTSVHAVMPRPNADFHRATASLHQGPVGCSWMPEPGCRED
jgi:arylsulfatase A